MHLGMDLFSNDEAWQRIIDFSSKPAKLKWTRRIWESNEHHSPKNNLFSFGDPLKGKHPHLLKPRNWENNIVNTTWGEQSFYCVPLVKNLKEKKVVLLVVARANPFPQLVGNKEQETGKKKKKKNKNTPMACRFLKKKIDLLPCKL